LVGRILAFGLVLLTARLTWSMRRAQQDVVDFAWFVAV
jgi:hypothetical protein